MQNIKIEAALVAATRMILAANEYLEARAEYKSGEYETYISAPKQSGALRRASMELTRALAEMRKP